MKNFMLLFLLFTTTTFAINFENIDTFSSKFTQTITDDLNKTITYHGELFTKKPSLALWNYKEPIEKSVYILGVNIVIVEPELEQAITKKLEKDLDIFSILSRAKKISKNSYKAVYNSQVYMILLDSGILSQISYIDSFENSVVVKFIDPKENILLEKKLFKIDLPSYYDIIKG
ncbi:MAG: outer membrane lipoprotein chaperone LolA [Helicobacteraceae bacterium]|nr:outer membrane lipoprotein chaperone LolA [Helicobacteraceae bacterium]